MRTDSVRISEEAQEKAKEFIENNLWRRIYSKNPRIYKGKKIFKMLMKL